MSSMLNRVVPHAYENNSEIRAVYLGSNEYYEL